MTLVNTLSRVPLVHDDPIDIPIDRRVLNSAEEARRAANNDWNCANKNITKINTKK